jgi:CDP-diglyceride synthetase
MHKQSIGRLSIAMSVPAALLWFGVTFFCAKWILASATGHLEPGANTSMRALLVFFLLTLLLSIGGIYLCFRAWMGKSNVKWQTISLMGAVLSFWAICGN